MTDVPNDTSGPGAVTPPGPLVPIDKQLILARGICEYDAALVGLAAIRQMASANREPTGRPVVVVPLGTLSRLRTELRLLLDRWDRDYPDAYRTVGRAEGSDLSVRAGHVRAWLTLHVEQLDALEATEGGD